MRLRGDDGPEKVTVLSVVHLLHPNDVHVVLLRLEAMEERLGQNEIILAATVHPQGRCRLGRQIFSSEG